MKDLNSLRFRKLARRIKRIFKWRNLTHSHKKKVGAASAYAIPERMRVTLLICLIMAGLAAWFVRAGLPEVATLRNQYPVVVYQGDKKPFRVEMHAKRPANWVTLRQISKSAIGAIVVSEDWAFYSHDGFDLNQIREAVRESWEAGELIRGASTITQQVARNVFLSQERTLIRKAKELWVAVKLEQEVGKRRILETYLNIAEWGRGVFGIQAASRYYFHKSAGELTAKEGAFLAMLLPSPKRYSQSFRRKKLTAYAEKTIDDILFKMEQARYITMEERDQELSQPLSFEMPDPELENIESDTSGGFTDA